MPNIRIPHSLRRFTGDKHVFTAEHNTLLGMLESLVEAHPAMRSVLFSREGTPATFVRLYVDGEMIEMKTDLRRTIVPEANITIITGIAGG